MQVVVPVQAEATIIGSKVPISPPIVDTATLYTEVPQQVNIAVILDQLNSSPPTSIAYNPIEETLIAIAETQPVP